ncbi:MAG: lecithin retinol acyltransferase family protein [Cyanobacteria bacterium]|nr:lecithin retinol acyltransferase family protein [Cyanobacteriota bacterium]MDA0866403.1 lecithin retinol acyltransferase family protein [Cyanobacteriota bacterium]
MARGDQIYAMREWIGISSVYEHHGIDCGDGTVIHYRKTDTAEVARTSIALFGQGKPITIKVQPVALLPDTVVERAESRLGEQRYDLLTNNCEHFATWCKTGRNESEQLAGFGLQLDRLQGVDLRRLIEGTTRDRSPEAAIALFHQALGDIAGAHRTLQTQYQRAKQDADTWQRVAQTALDQGREDLARAALHRKVTAKKKMNTFTQHLAELVEVQLTLEQNRRLSEQKLR